MRILKIYSLPKTTIKWVDRDEIMLHACFQILQDCMELEELSSHCNYEAHKDFVDEVRFLYDWWLKRKNNETTEDNTEDDEMLNRLMKIRTSLWT